MVNLKTTNFNTPIKGCDINIEMANFFGPSCVPGLPKNESESLRKLCQPDFSSDVGALHCLSSGVGDVAFVSSNSIRDFVSSQLLKQFQNFVTIIKTFL